jgi:hypothetical protein
MKAPSGELFELRMFNDRKKFEKKKKKNGEGRMENGEWRMFRQPLVWESKCIE